MNIQCFRQVCARQTDTWTLWLLELLTEPKSIQNSSSDVSPKDLWVRINVGSLRGIRAQILCKLGQGLTLSTAGLVDFDFQKIVLAIILEVIAVINISTYKSNIWCKLFCTVKQLSISFKFAFPRKFVHTIKTGMGQTLINLQT